MDPVQDENLAEFVISSHIKSNVHHSSNPAVTAEAAVTDNDETDHPVTDNRDVVTENRDVVTDNREIPTESDTNLIEPSLLQKYIVYARAHVQPTVSAALDTRKIETFYATLRKASQHTGINISISIYDISKSIEIYISMIDILSMHGYMSVYDDDISIDASI